MTRIQTSLFVVAFSVAILLLPMTGSASPARAELPLVGGKPALATINGEALTLDEFERVLGSIHKNVADNSIRSMPHPFEVLDRLINAKLVLQEARNIGLDELPEIRSAEKAFAEETLRGMLYGYQIRNVRKGDPKEVEKRYREAVKEVKVSSVLFGKEADAKKFEAEVRAGGNFDALAKKRVKAGEAKGGSEGRFIRFGSLSPVVGKALSGMKKGEISPLIRIGEQFSLVRLEAVRYPPKDPTARKEAEKGALQAKRSAVLEAYVEGLRKKYAKVDRDLLRKIDYESGKAQFEKYRTDQRTLATVKGEKPLTVADLTAAIEKRFFHGVEQAVQKKKVNPMKEQVLQEVLNGKVAMKEAKVQKLDRTEYFREKMEERRNGLLFGAFVQKVILPDVKTSEEELKSYYRKHAGDYSAPEMVRIDGLAFASQASAENVLVKLRSGADFQWERTNAEGQVDPAKAKNLIDFRGRLFEASSLPDGVRKAISGAGAGEYRLYTDPGNVSYVLLVRDRIPSKPMPFESVEKGIRKKVFSDKVQRSLHDWEGKLRKASDIKVYVTEEKLVRIVNPGAR